MNAVVVAYAPLALSGSLRRVLEVHNGYHYHRCKRAYGDTNRVMGLHVWTSVNSIMLF